MCEHKREVCDFVQGAFKNSPILSTQRQIELLQKYRASKCPTERAKLKRQLVSTLWRFAVKEASKFESVIDVRIARQAAYMGVLRALDKYRVKSRSALTTCVFWWVRLEIIRTIYKVKYQIHIPEYLYTRIKKAISQAKNGELLTKQEIILLLYGNNPNNEEVRKVDAFSQVYISESGNPSEESEALIIDKGFEIAEMRVDIFKAIKKKTPIKMAIDPETGKEMVIEYPRYILDERSRNITTLYYNLDGKGAYGLREIGEIYNITRERVRQILLSVRAYLKEELKDYDTL